MESQVSSTRKAIATSIVRLLSRMNDSQSHRGPDGKGEHHEPGVALGHRRLAIIDIETGQQPLYNEDQSVVVVFNGEIYNYQQLIPELGRSGTASARAATLKSSYTHGSRGVSGALNASGACSRLRFGIGINRRFSWRVTG